MVFLLQSKSIFAQEITIDTDIIPHELVYLNIEEENEKQIEQ